MYILHSSHKYFIRVSFLPFVFVSAHGCANTKYTFHRRYRTSMKILGQKRKEVLVFSIIRRMKGVCFPWFWTIFPSEKKWLGDWHTGQFSEALPEAEGGMRDLWETEARTEYLRVYSFVCECWLILWCEQQLHLFIFSFLRRLSSRSHKQTNRADKWQRSQSRRTERLRQGKEENKKKNENGVSPIRRRVSKRMVFLALALVCSLFICLFFSLANRRISWYAPVPV